MSLIRIASAALALTAAALGVAGSGVVRPVFAADAPSLQTLFDLYDRGEYDAFDRSVAVPKGIADEWRDVEREAFIWVYATPDPTRPDRRRRLVAASVGLELAYVHREKWSRARALIESACRLLHTPLPPRAPPTTAKFQPPPLPEERWWHLAAASLAQSVGDFRFLLPAPMTSVQPAQTRLPLPSDLYLNHGQHALTRFQSDPGLQLAFGIALETETTFTMTGEDLPMWTPAERVDRLMASTMPTLPPNARMDVDSAVKLLALRNRVPQPAAEKSMQLWTIASRLREAVAGADVAPEAYMRLGHTFLRLARPEGALVELGRAEKSSTTPFVRYMARYFGGVALDRLGRHDEALRAYRGALEAVPRAQSATMALTSALFQRGDREEAISLVQRSLTTPLANDPLKYYKAGDAADEWPARRAQLRKVLR